MRSLVLCVGAVFALTGCDRLHNERICSTVIPLSPSSSNLPDSLRKEETAKNCVHKWAYRLARSTDPADDVAEAVMGACWDTVFPWAYARYDAARSRGFAGEVTVSTRTGREIPYGEDAYEELRALALFHVVQARAGHCRLPSE